MTALPKAILLDMDDTILDFSSGADSSWARVADLFSERLGGCPPGDFLGAIDRSRRWFWSDPDRHRAGRLNIGHARQGIVTSALGDLDIEDPELASELGAAYEEIRFESIHPYPGAIETLGELRSRGVSLALITNGDAAGQRRKIERFDLARFFACILIEEEFGVGKPDRRVFLHALGELGAEPGEAWMVGDNLEWEIHAPQQLGIYSIWVDAAGMGLPQSSEISPDRTIRSLVELVEE